MTRLVTRIMPADWTPRGPLVRRARACGDCYQDFGGPYSLATTVIEEDDAAGVLITDPRGRPLIASVRAVVGFSPPSVARGR